MTDLTDIEKEHIELEFNNILSTCKGCQKSENKIIIRKAFDLANEAHSKMRRRSGEPYIYHPIEVAKIASNEIGLGTKSIICALLHDVVEDTDYTLEDIESLFGKKIASIIDGLTKISDVFDQESLQAENFKKIILTLSEDVRVILIKLADRLHNMRTLDSMPDNKQVKIASETLSLYAPLAHRLGLYNIKSELEDLSLKYKHPLIYNEIKNKITESTEKREIYINKFSSPVIEKLSQKKIKYSITGRSKSIYSIWKKMNTKNIEFSEIYDLFAIRIVFSPKVKSPEKTQCWNIYSLITDIYQPNPDRLRDWVSTPKSNGYEALHTTVMGPGQWVEVQIRTDRMNEIAERGYAAHYKYKGDKTVDSGELDIWLKKIKELLSSNNSSALDFLDEFKLNLYSKEIYVFTPKGLLLRLPKGATVLDYAYEIHSEIGNNAIGAKIKQKLVSLDYKLQSGDQIEILTSKRQVSDPKSLDFVITAKAKNALKSLLKKIRLENVEKGKEILQEKVKELNLNPSTITFNKLLKHYSVRSKDELYCKIGRGIIDISNLKKIISKKAQNKWVRYWQLQYNRSSTRKKIKGDIDSEKSIVKTQQIELTENFDYTNYEIAQCCNPIPGDKISGYLENNKDVIIHKSGCDIISELATTQGNNIISVNWTTHKMLSFLARIELNGIDKIGILNKITNIISKELDVNMRSATFDSRGGIFKGTIDLYIHNKEDLDKLIIDLKKIKGINSVIRIEELNDTV